MKCKDYLIAKALINIIYNNQTAMNKRNDIFTILNTCQTINFNTESIVQGVGYTRKLRECFEIDSAATSREEIGCPPHYGTVNKLRQVGIPVVPHRARQMTKADYEYFDYLIHLLKILNLS